MAGGCRFCDCESELMEEVYTPFGIYIDTRYTKLLKILITYCIPVENTVLSGSSNSCMW